MVVFKKTVEYDENDVGNSKSYAVSRTLSKARIGTIENKEEGWVLTIPEYVGVELSCDELTVMAAKIREISDAE